MAIEDTNESRSDGVDGGVTSPDRTATVGEYTWEDLRRELHDGGPFDRTAYLGFGPESIEDRLEDAAGIAKGVNQPFAEYIDPETTPVVKGTYTWEQFKQEYYYEAGAKPWHNGDQPTDSSGEVVPFDPASHLGFDPERTENRLSRAEDFASALGMSTEEFEAMRDENPDELMRQMAQAFAEGGDRADASATNKDSAGLAEKASPGGVPPAHTHLVSFLVYNCSSKALQTSQEDRLNVPTGVQILPNHPSPSAFLFYSGDSRGAQNCSGSHRPMCAGHL